MSYFVNTGFRYADIDSSSMHLIICEEDSNSLLEMPYGVLQKEIGEQIKSNYYHYRTDLDIFSFELNFTFDDIDKYLFDYDTRIKINQWLIQKDFKPFISDDYPNICFYAKANGAIKLKHNSRDQGILTIPFICNAPYGFQYPQGIAYEEDFSDNTSAGKTIIVSNLSNVSEFEYFYPEIEIELGTGDTGVTINNLTDGNRLFEFTGLDANETVYVDCQNERIISSTGKYRLDKLTATNGTKLFLRLWQGENQLLVKNFHGKIRYRCQFPMAI